MFDIEKLLVLIEAYCREASISKSAFGKKVLNNPNFVYDLASGKRNPRAKTCKQVYDFLVANGYE